MFAQDKIHSVTDVPTASMENHGKPARYLTPKSLASALRRRGPTVVAEGVTMTGGLTATGVVEIRGKICGDVCCAEVEIRPGGCVEGNIVADDVVVAGDVRGSIFASQVELKRTARATGGILFQRLLMTPGAYCVEGPDCQCRHPDAAGTQEDLDRKVLPSDVRPTAFKASRGWARKIIRRLNFSDR